MRETRIDGGEKGKMPGLLSRLLGQKRRTSNREGKLWGALKKAWKGYKIAKAKNEPDKAAKYALAINELQAELDLDITRFKELEDFYRELEREED